MAIDTDYYRRLNVSPDCTPQEIAHRRRMVSKIIHPDKGGDDEKMKGINKAYEVLSDPETRQIYDVEGKRFFEPTGVKADPIELTLYVTTEELLHKMTKTIIVSATRHCTSCNGTGYFSSTIVCGDCFGYEVETLSLEITLCSTMMNGDKIVFGGIGNQYLGIKQGNIEFTIRTYKDGFFGNARPAIQYPGVETETVSNMLAIGDGGIERQNNDIQQRRVHNRKLSLNYHGNLDRKPKSLPAPSVNSGTRNTISRRLALTSNNPANHDAVVETAAQNEKRKNEKQQQGPTNLEGGSDNNWTGRFRKRAINTAEEGMRRATKLTGDKNITGVTDSAKKSARQKKCKVADPATSPSKGKNKNASKSTPNVLKSVSVPGLLEELGEICYYKEVWVRLYAKNPLAEDKFARCVYCPFLVHVPKETEQISAMEEIYYHYLLEHYGMKRNHVATQSYFYNWN